MLKNYEVLEVFTDKKGDVVDLAHVSCVTINEKSQQFTETVMEALENCGIAVDNSWNISRDEDMGIIDIYNSKGKYIYTS